MSSLRLVMVDDHPLFRSGLRLLLQDIPDIEVVGEATTGQEAVRLTSELNPEILLLDLNLPDASGITLLAELKRCSPQTRVIVLTMHNDVAFRSLQVAQHFGGGVQATGAHDAAAGMTGGTANV